MEKAFTVFSLMDFLLCFRCPLCIRTVCLRGAAFIYDQLIRTRDAPFGLILCAGLRCCLAMSCGRSGVTPLS